MGRIERTFDIFVDTHVYIHICILVDICIKVNATLKQNQSELAMTMNVTEQTLLEGSWWALEQAGRLLRSAITLLESGDPSTALAVAMFGREELGRSRLLRDCAQEVHEGKALQAHEITKRCEDHVRKQGASAFGVTLRPSSDSQIGKALSAMTQHEPGSEEWSNANDLVNSAADAKQKRQPHDRHQARCKGLYVDLNDSGTNWLRPIEISREEARINISDAVNDYAQEVDRLTNEGLRTSLQQNFPRLNVEAMSEARTRMPHAVDLPRPVWPRLEEGMDNKDTPRSEKHDQQIN